MSGHFIRYGSCGHVVTQCRCPGISHPKTIERVAEPCAACRAQQEQEAKECPTG